MVGSDTFEVLNERREVHSASAWNHPDQDKLWLYNLHYFDDLNAQGSDERTDWHRALIERWIAENPPGEGNGWEPYPLSLRIVNWIKWELAGNELEDDWIYSLSVQARFLSRRLEYHLLGNHLFANAKALVFAGLFFEGEEAERWLSTGLRILKREVPEQVLPDGGHFELSPMYHVIILEDLLDLVNLYRSFDRSEPRAWLEAVERMRAWLKVMTHPDGQISLFNDAALNIAVTPVEIEAYAGRLGLDEMAGPPRGLQVLPDSGYVRLENASATCFLDVARIGPDYLPGHAHADTLTFEWSLGRQRLVVNSGTSCYGTSAERLRQRGTAAHNTVVVNDEDSSEVWGGFRVARRARSVGLEHEETENGGQVSCGHDGYTRLAKGLIHRRRWRLDAGRLVIHDRVAGPFDEAEGRYHFDPAVNVYLDSETRGTVNLPDRERVEFEVVGGKARLESSTYHPCFGVSEPNQCLVIDFRSSDCECLFSWPEEVAVT